MMSSLPIACLQLTPDGDRAAGTLAAVTGIRHAASQGARLVALPEYAIQLHSSGRVMKSGAGNNDTDESLTAVRAVARECGVWVLLGSITMRTASEKISNRSYLVSEQGVVVATYDKLHMFDATLPDGRSIREGNLYEAGSRAVVVESHWGRLGLTICYDLRFPQLFRALAQAGAKVIFAPSAFTLQTGRMHWHALLRARAIENGCYIVAPATCGTSPDAHATFGHSMVVDPFGAVVMEAGDDPGVFLSTLDMDKVELARSRIPSLTHDRPFTVDVVNASGGFPK